MDGAREGTEIWLPRQTEPTSGLFCCATCISHTFSGGAIRQDVVARQDEELTLVKKCISDVCHIFPDIIYCAKRRSSCRGSSSENRRFLTADCAMPGNLGKINSIFNLEPLETQYATIEDILADRSA